MGRWDRFHEARSFTPETLLAEEVVKSLLADLARWPPPVEWWSDEKLKERYAPVLSPFYPGPPAAVYRSAFELAIWELERRYDALDDFARNSRAAEVASDPRDRLALEFLHRWLTDSMLELLEVQRRLKRPGLVECLERARGRLVV